jgi:hypothetical protein
MGHIWSMSDDTKHPTPAKPAQSPSSSVAETAQAVEKKPVIEIGGPKGPEPTRYGDWEQGGRCSDF